MVLCIVELSVLALFFILGILLNAGKNKYIDAPLSEWKSGVIRYSGNDWHVVDGQFEAEGDPVTLIYGPYIPLHRGTYTVEIDYSADQTQSAVPHSPTKFKFIRGNSFNLDKNLNHVSYDFKTTEDLDDFEVVVKYNRKGSFYINGITIRTNHNGVKQGFLWLLLAFLAFDGILIFRRLSDRQKLNVLAVIGIVLVSTLPLLYKGINRGHDLLFHLNRIEGIADELRNGHFPVRMQSRWNSEYGYPVSLYYGDWLLYFPAILRIMGVPLILAYKIYVFFVALMSTIISYFSFYHIFSRNGLALLLSLAYMTSTYRMSDVFVRSAVGEYTALMFLPLVALAVWKLYTIKDITRDQQRKIVLAFGTGMAGIFTTHILSVEMVVIVLAIVAVLLIPKTIRPVRLKVYGLSILMTGLLSCFFLVPFLDVYFHVSVKINQVLDYTNTKLIEDRGSFIADYFTFFKWMPYGHGRTWASTPGIVLMGALIAGVVIWIMHRANRKIKYLVIFSLIVIWISSNLFPWNAFSYHKKIGALMAQVQFPWRYISLACVFLCLLLGELCVWTGTKKNRRVVDHDSLPFCLSTVQIQAICAAVSVCMALFYLSGYVTFKGTSNVKFRDTAEINSHSVGGGEYLAYNAESDLISDNKQTPSGFKEESCEVSDFYRRDGVIGFKVITGTDDGSVLLPEYQYIHYEAVGESGNQFTIARGENNRILVRIPSGYNGYVTVRYRIPRSWRISELISLLTIAGVIVCAAHKKWRKK